jgi:hypothetical protein
MHDNFHSIPGFFWGRPSLLSDLTRIEAEEGISLPNDYKQLLLNYGAGEGFIGKKYLILWDASEILSNNEGYQTKLYARGFLLIGSNGGGEGFAFDFTEKSPPIVAIPLVGMSSTDAKRISDNIADFFTKLQVSDDLF